MKLLLDTCAFLWFLADDASLSKTAKAAILNPSNEVYLSAVSVWEIGRKFTNGALNLPAQPDIIIPFIRDASGISSLPLTEAHVLMAEKLPLLHKDPFDRMLIAQALVGGMKVVTADRVFEAYPVPLLW